MKRTLLVPALLALTAVTAFAQSPILTYSGTLDATDRTFNRAASAFSLSSVGGAVAYETFSFTSNSLGGAYQILGDYRGGGGLTDGFLYIYNAFNPANALSGLVAGDDDFSISGADALSGSFLADASSFGPGVIGNRLILDPNTTYTVVVSGFANSDLGAFSVSVAAVPEPSTMAIGSAALGLLTLVALRRSQSAA